MAGFSLSAMAYFVKDGGTTVPYSDMEVPHVGQYGGFLALRHPPSTTLPKTLLSPPNSQTNSKRFELRENRFFSE